ncbi:MAG: hypothetical protein K8S98_16865 [Planctomycetes bacterium]|nr:hypothetical protein [Planctomycetota bacterium]
MLRFPTRREGFATLVALLVAPLAHAQFQADPFQPGLRSTHSATAAQAWLPQSVDFVAGGELVWAAGSGTASELGVLSSAPSGAIQPEFVDSSIFGTQGTVVVASGKRADRLFSAAQFVVSDAAHKRTLVRAHDALDAAASGTFATRWVHDLGLVGNGPAKLACDAASTRVVAAMSDANTGTLRIDWLDGANGALLTRADLAQSPLRVLAATNDLSRTALVAGTTLVVFDANGLVVHQENLGAATYAMALSGDGSELLVGAQNRLRVLARQSDSTYATAFTITAAPSEIATRAALSDDGSTWAVGWWNSITATAIRFELWDGPSQTRAWFGVQSGPPGSLQNYPEAVAVTPDGRRAAFAAWGIGDTQPELLLVDKQLAAPVLAVDLGGSALSLALADDGARVVVGKKHVHANQFGSTGEFRIYDTGERDLQLVAAPHHGGSLALKSRHPGSSIILFVVGVPSNGPQTFPGCIGTLWIDRKALPKVFARPSDAQGEASFSLPLANSPSVIGTTFAVQAAARAGGKLYFSTSVVAPVVL